MAATRRAWPALFPATGPAREQRLAQGISRIETAGGWQLLPSRGWVLVAGTRREQGAVAAESISGSMTNRVPRPLRGAGIPTSPCSFCVLILFFSPVFLSLSGDLPTRLCTHRSDVLTLALPASAIALSYSLLPVVCTFDPLPQSLRLSQLLVCLGPSGYRPKGYPAALGASSQDSGPGRRTSKARTSAAFQSVPLPAAGTPADALQHTQRSCNMFF